MQFDYVIVGAGSADPRALGRTGRGAGGNDRRRSEKVLSRRDRQMGGRRKGVRREGRLNPHPLRCQSQLIPASITLPVGK